MNKLYIELNRDIMYEYFKFYKNKYPRAKTFPFSTKETVKLFKNEKPQLTKTGRQKVKKKSRKINEIKKEHLFYKVISLNELLPINSMNYKTTKTKWGELGIWLADKYNYNDLNLTNSLIEVKFFNETKANSDNDNSIGASKILFDGLYSKSNMFIDDNYNHINPLIVSTEYDKNNPRMEIRITTFEENIKDVYTKIDMHLELWNEKER